MREENHDREFRDRVTWLMFLFGLLVIWVHSYNADLFFTGEDLAGRMLAEKVETFLSVGIGQTAVPGFFLLSSYLFFRNFSLDKTLKKWKSRVFSILIPYIAWNLLYYLVYAAGSRILGGLFGREELIPVSLSEAVRAVTDYAYAPIFWYLYQLIFLILLSPVLYLLVKRRATGLCLIISLMFAAHLHLDTGHPNTDALFYYAVAAYFAVHRKDQAEGSENKKRYFAEAIAGFLIALYCYRQMSVPGADVLWTIWYRMAFPMSCWVLACALPTPKIRPWMRQSLFLYAVHFLIVRLINKEAAVWAGRYLKGSFTLQLSLGVYLLLPAVTAAISYLAAKILVTVAPPIWRILSGGRNLED